MAGLAVVLIWRGRESLKDRAAKNPSLFTDDMSIFALDFDESAGPQSAPGSVFLLLGASWPDELLTTVNHPFCNALALSFVTLSISFQDFL